MSRSGPAGLAPGPPYSIGSWPILLTSVVNADQLMPTSQLDYETIVTPYKERWAEALAVLKQHGRDAPNFIGERISTLTKSGDLDGVTRWTEIADRVDSILEADDIRH